MLETVVPKLFADEAAEVRALLARLPEKEAENARLHKKISEYIERWPQATTVEIARLLKEDVSTGLAPSPKATEPAPWPFAKPDGEWMFPEGETFLYTALVKRVEGTLHLDQVTVCERAEEAP